MTDIIIIGAGCAGLTAAIYAQRAGLHTILLEENFYGGQIAVTNEIENYPAIPSITGPELAQQIYAQAESLGAQFRFEAVTQAELAGNPKIVETNAGRYEAKAVIIANGAKRRKLGCPGEAELTGRGVSYCATCDGAFFRGKDVAIVGGGNTALEDALFLSNVCRTVFLIHRRDAFRGERALANRVRQRENIQILYDSTVSEIRGEARVTSAVIQNIKTGEQQELPVSAVFVAIGLIPENGIFSRQLPLDESGYFIAGEDCKTPLAGVFVAGDCRVKPLRQIITAAADGAVAGYQAAAYIG
ncbi:MAG TPA: thioredoxin-disulfide reductase [Candidatus Fimivicinus intestinavium]|nr:thioredoxin-disulfide reductase [Candidatus Fimivicinus intestinavium]